LPPTKLEQMLANECERGHLSSVRARFHAGRLKKARLAVHSQHAHGDWRGDWHVTVGLRGVADNG